MTSGNPAAAVWRELRFGTVPGAVHAPRGALAAGDGVRFRFVTDFDSVERWPDVPYDTADPSARHGDPARARIVAVLDHAAQTMARRVPAALRLVDDQLQRVLLRRSENASGGSASHRAHVGSCLLTNLHQPAQAALVAIEAVTHESIHQLLYRTERSGGNFCDLAATPTLRSPWSGARLPLHSLVHACFVWFGLLALWSELALEPASDDEAVHARARIAHCLFGFAFLDDLLDSPAFPKARVDTQVLAVIRAMSAAARGATRAAEPCPTLRQVASSRRDAGWPAAIAAGLAPVGPS
jgi:HEXXH motif-containing protein